MTVRGNMRRWVADAGKWATGELSRGLKTLFGSRAGQSLGTLMYPHVAPHYPGVPKPTWNATPQRFRQQIKGLLDRGFQIWPLQARCGAW